MKIRKANIITTGALILLCILHSGAAFDPVYKGCEFKESDFTMEVLVTGPPALSGPGRVMDPTIRGPLQIVFDSIIGADGYIDADIYWVNRFGAVKRLRAGAATVELLGTFEVWHGDDYGLLGLELDPDFKSNGWMYFWYSPPPLPEFGTNKIGNHMKLVRVTLKDGKLDFSTEKVLYTALANVYDYTKAIWHAGGPMQFDAQGNLWFTYGNNSTDHNSVFNGSQVDDKDSIVSDTWGAGNTANARGSILKIKPIPFPDTEDREPGIGSTYEIPEGNFGEYFSDYWKERGDDALAEMYLDPGLVLPEIYIKGFRSIFSVNVDPYYNWVSWGEINPGYPRDEWWIVKHPVYSGYPYFAGWNDNGTQWATTGHSQTPDSIVNNSPLSNGIKRLPPARGATLPAQYNKFPNGTSLARSSMGGPVYWYNGQLNSNRMFPPHFNEMWFVMDYQTRWKAAIEIDYRSDPHEILRVSGMDIFTDKLQFPNTARGHWPLDIEFGPDNSLYIVDYGTRNVGAAVGSGQIVRFSYNQACKDPDLVPPFTVSVNPPVVKNLRDLGVRNTGNKIFFTGSGNHELQVRDMNGRILLEMSGNGRKSYDISNWDNISNGIYFISVKTSKGLFNWKQVLK
jgi:cytochrome c